MQEADQLADDIDGEQTHYHPLDEEQCLQQEVEQHVGNDFTDTGKGVWLSARNFKCEICDVLKPDGIDDLTEHKQGEDPEGTEDGGENKLQPRPDIAM